MALVSVCVCEIERERKRERQRERERKKKICNINDIESVYELNSSTIIDSNKFEKYHEKEV